ncbi:MAG TPA: DNA-directed RNA polymerase subunit beta', partial [Verrucomicrobiae bacterium]|nr:DNA-directed RNA polymerase subunit beta' [Verrucomicrobiae bacterium]
DFDGDQMAVHIPLSPEAQVEASVLMLASHNILSPASGQPITVPTQDMVLGIYYLTKAKPGAKGEGRAFANIDEVLLAKEMVELQEPIVWDILEEVIRDHPVLLNRAPTLHRLGIQAFEPVLVEGKAIKIHPLVCTAFNADFDGDQMAVHIPLSPEAQVEASVLMLSSHNILSPASGQPITVPTQDMVLGLYYLTKSKKGAKGEGRAFANIEEVLMALDARELETLSPIRLRYTGPVLEMSTAYDDQDLTHTEPVQYDRQFISTTVGRAILNDALPNEMPYVNGLLKKKGIGQLVNYCYLNHGLELTVQMLDRIKELGFQYATRSGLSVGLDDMVIPEAKYATVRDAEKQAIAVQQQYLDGAITNGERNNKVIQIWSAVTERVADEMFDNMKRADKEGAMNPIYIMADSGARGSKQQIRQLSGMRGLMAKPSGEIIETPITANFREGLTVLEYFISTHGARKGLADTALKTADSGYLTRRLVDVAQDVIVSERDCKTVEGIYVTPIVESGEIIEPLRDRIVGRVSLEKIKDYEGQVIVDVNQEITEDLASAIQAAGIERVKIRSVLTCESRRGVCVLCYGRNLGSGRLVELGEAVGVIAAQSIGEPGTQLTMRTFHIGGTATRVTEQSKIEARNNGFVRFIDLKVVEGRGKTIVAMNRSGLVAVVDEKGREKERHHVVYGARVRVEDGQPVTLGQVMCEWDPYTFSILTELGGTVQFKDLQPGLTIEEQVDEVTGLSQLVVTLPPGDEKHQPTIQIRGSGGRIKKYLMPSRAHLMVADGDEVQPGDVLAKIPRETTKTKDITGGLPRVVELFETRKPKDPAVISEIDGVVKYGEIAKGQRKIYVESEDGRTTKEYSIPRGIHINVQEGEHVRAGEPLIDGPLNPHDLLAVLGEKYTQAYLVNSIQEVYRLQGVNINDKHIETIVRQMMRWVKVEDVGDTPFLLEEQVDKFRFREENDHVIHDGGRPATGRPLLLGITKASLSTDSFISAASFQETTRVLTEAAISGKVDYLRGLKENVIMGRLIPAGTGLERYRSIQLLTEIPKEEPEMAEPELTPEEAAALDFLRKDTDAVAES